MKHQQNSRDRASTVNTLASFGLVGIAPCNGRGIAQPDRRFHPYGFMCEDLKLTVKHPIRDSREAAISGGFMGAAINVGEVYVQLIRDLRECTYTHRALNTLFTMLV